MKTKAWLPRLIWSVCATGTAAGVVLGLAPATRLGAEVALRFIIPIGLLAFPTVGAIVASRKPNNVIGWLFLGFGLTSGLGLAADAYAAFQPALPGAGYAGDVAVGTINSPIVMSFFAFFLLLFPNGRLPTRRWRPFAWYCVAVSGLVEFYAVFVQPTLEVGDVKEIPNPLAIRGLAPVSAALQGALYPALIICVPIAAVAFVLHYRRSRGLEREQMKWFASAAVVLAVMIGLAPIGFSSRAPKWLWPVMFLVGASSVPVAAGIAILKYRLYDIERIISRTVAYAIITAVLGGAFTLVVLVPTAVVGAGVKTPDWLVAIATLAVAALFRPVRRRVQNAIDHRFNRRRYDTARTIESFAGRLRNEVDIATLRTDLETLIHQTMQPSHVSVWLRDRTT
jgi:hypothetical protein